MAAPVGNALYGDVPKDANRAEERHKGEIYMLTPPYDHPCNLVMQDIMNYVSYGLTLVLLLVTLRMGKKERTPFYTLLLLAVFVGAVAEPIYDEGMMLLFYVPGIISHFTAFNIPQPLWTHSGYAILYAFPAIMICNRIYKGTLTLPVLFAFAGLEMAMSCTFEILGINFGTYSYWGPHVFRIIKYPLVVGILETAQTICFSIAAANLRYRASSNLHLLGLFVLFPLTMIGVNLGVGMTTVVALHWENTTPLIVTIGTVISIIFALVAIRGAASVIPPAGSAKAGFGALFPGSQSAVPGFYEN